MRWFDNSDREAQIVSKLALAKITGYGRIGAGTWFATYDPETNDLCLSFNKGKEARETYEIRLAADIRTGATWLTLDGVHHTIESMATVGRFTIPLSNYLGTNSCGYQEWIYAEENIKPLSAWLRARCDDASALKLEETFPKLFMPPTEPTQPSTPQPTLPARKRGLFGRRR